MIGIELPGRHNRCDVLATHGDICPLLSIGPSGVISRTEQLNKSVRAVRPAANHACHAPQIKLPLIRQAAQRLRTRIMRDESLQLQRENQDANATANSNSGVATPPTGPPCSVSHASASETVDDFSAGPEAEKGSLHREREHPNPPGHEAAAAQAHGGGHGQYHASWRPMYATSLIGSGTTALDARWVV